MTSHFRKEKGARYRERAPSLNQAEVAKLVDAGDLESPGEIALRVRLPPSAPLF